MTEVFSPYQNQAEGKHTIASDEEVVNNTSHQIRLDSSTKRRKAKLKSHNVGYNSSEQNELRHSEDYMPDVKAQEKSLMKKNYDSYNDKELSI